MKSGNTVTEQIELQQTEAPPPRAARRAWTEQDRLAGMNVSVTGLDTEQIAQIEEIGFYCDRFYKKVTGGGW